MLAPTPAPCQVPLTVARCPSSLQPVHWYRERLQALGVPDIQLFGLDALRTGSSNSSNGTEPAIAYTELLNQLPPELGVRMEGYYSLMEVESMARQYHLLRQHRTAMQVSMRTPRMTLTTHEGLNCCRCSSTPVTPWHFKEAPPLRLHS